MCPEKLFQSTDGRGIQNTVYDSVYYATQTHPELLETFFGNIVLAGGSTKFHGFDKRLSTEVTKLIPETLGFKASVVAPPARQTLSWRGGSLRACLDNNTINLERYNELGTYRSFWSQFS
jgi:actin-related protein